MSKDISLVNSDNESSIVNLTDDGSIEQLQELIIGLQDQLKAKDLHVKQIQTTLDTQKLTIESLENSNRKLQGIVDSSVEKLSRIEGENEYLKSTIISLNSIIEGQNQHIETAKNNIESYNSTIQKLQKELEIKESIHCGKIDDIALETMIANENKVIANNQNLNNIILSFKVALESKSDEINSLKTLLKENDKLKSENITLKNQLNFQGRQMSTLIIEMETLQERITENLEMISRLITTEELLNSKVSNLQKQNEILQKMNQEKCILPQNLQGDEKLSVVVSEIKVKEQEPEQLNEEIEQVRNELILKTQETHDFEKNLADLQSQVDELTVRHNEYVIRDEGLNQQIEQLTQTIEVLQHLVQIKDQEILSFKAHIDETGDDKNKLILQNQDYLQQISSLSKELEIITKDQLEKNETIRKLEDKLFNYKSLKIKIEELTEEKGKVTNNNEDLMKKIAHLSEEHNKAQKLLVEKGHEVEDMKREINEVKEENTDIKAKIEKVVNERVGIILSNEDFPQKILQLSEYLAKNQHDIETKEQDIRNLQIILDENDKKYKYIHMQLEECNQGKHDLLCKNEKLSHELAVAQKDIKLKEQLILDLETKCKDANGAKAALQLQVEELNQASAEFMHCNDSLSIQIKQLTEVRDKVNNELEIKKHEFSALLSKLTEENNHNNAAQSQIDELQQAKYELLRRNDNTLQQVKELNEEMNTFRKELEVRNNYINDLEIKLKESEKNNCELSIYQLHFTELSDIRYDLVRQNENLKQHTAQLIEKSNNIRSELDVKNQDVIDLESKLNDVKENNEYLRNELLQKENMISSLQNRITNLNPESRTLTQNEQVDIKDRVNEICSFKSEIEIKEKKIEELGHQIKCLELTLEEQFKKSNELQQGLKDAVSSRKTILKKVFDFAKGVKIEQEIGIKSSSTEENDIDCILDVVRSHVIPLITSKGNEQEIKQMLLAAKEDIEDLTRKNVELISEYSEMATKNRDLHIELQKVSSLNKDLLNNTEFMLYLKSELSDKCDELTGMKTKVNLWKDQFICYQDLMKKQMIDLQLEKDILEDLQRSWQLSSIRRNSPQSLLTICCNKLIETLQLKENFVSTEPVAKLHRTESNMDICDVTFSDSKSTIELRHVESSTQICLCSELNLELQLAKTENEKLNKIIKDLESNNKYLLKEKEEVRKEIQQLVEPVIDLQKKITNHRTNLSTLTATTYAENKLLNSQLKVLKHYHTRYIHVCQRDIPAVKSQLHELMSILKDNSSFLDKQNSSFKRYSLPDVLDNNSMITNFKNESTLDGDLLMLDTNVTLTTSADNTLIGQGLLECSPKPDRTCLDVTQIHFDSEVACQTSDLSKMIDPYTLSSQIESLTDDNQKMIAILEALTEENAKLKEEMNNRRTETNCSRSVDTQRSPIKFNETCNDSISKMVSEKCKREQEVDKLRNQMKSLTQELQEAVAHKISIEKKYNDLVTEMPAVTTLAKKLSDTEIDCQNKMQEVVKLTKDLSKKNSFIKELQEENDSLSTQLMEGITEADDLRKELDTLKNSYSHLIEKCSHLEKITNESRDNDYKENDKCSQCANKDIIIQLLKNKHTTDPHSKLNRSLSDSESSSRLNKLNTLQSELHASKEDCKKITEEVSTIKNHLEQSNLSMSQAMDLDESMGESKIFSFSKSDEQHLNRFMPSIPEERPIDSYNLDKIDCINFYADKTGIDKENLTHDMKIIDVLKLLYDSLIAKHGNEVQNLFNKLRDFEDTKNLLQSQIGNITAENLRITKSLKEKENNVKNITNAFTQIISNINTIGDVSDNNQSSIVSLFKDNYLEVIDKAFDLSSKSIFESLINSIDNKHQNDLKNAMEKCSKLQDQLGSVFVELNDVSKKFNVIKEQLSTKENEYNLLKDQKERIHEISNAVTLDIVQRDHELGEIVKNSYDKLVALKMLSTFDMRPNLTVNEKIKLLLDGLTQCVIKIKSERDHLQEMENLKTAFEVKQTELESMKMELAEKEGSLRNQTVLYDDLSKLYQHNLEQNKDRIEMLKTEINVLKDTLSKKVELIEILDGKLSSKLEESFSESINEFMQKIQSLEQENANLKSVNQIIAKEKQILVLELEKSGEMIKNYKMDIDKMTTDIIVLKESVSENMAIVDSLTLESKSLLENNMLLKKQYEEKCQDCLRLETNIKILEKTAEIQNKTILR